MKKKNDQKLYSGKESAKLLGISEVAIRASAHDISQRKTRIMGRGRPIYVYSESDLKKIVMWRIKNEKGIGFGPFTEKIVSDFANK